MSKYKVDKLYQRYIQYTQFQCLNSDYLPSRPCPQTEGRVSDLPWVNKQNTPWNTTRHDNTPPFWGWGVKEPKQINKHQEDTVLIYQTSASIPTWAEQLIKYWTALLFRRAADFLPWRRPEFLPKETEVCRTETTISPAPCSLERNQTSVKQNLSWAPCSSERNPNFSEAEPILSTLFVREKSELQWSRTYPGHLVHQR